MNSPADSCSAFPVSREFPSPLRGGVGEGDGCRPPRICPSPHPGPPPQWGRGFGAAPVAQQLTGGRLHLSHGPIDVVLRAFGAPEAVARAHQAAARRFPDILPELCAELPRLRAQLGKSLPPLSSVGRRMAAACRPFADVFVTPMAAVAGAVAEELLSVMRAAAPLDRAYVNDGGDIAVFCALGKVMDIAIASDFTLGPLPGRSGTIRVRHGDGVGGIATSGARGRSFSLGIADSVTALAADAATADVAATLIGNAVDCDDPAIGRRPACGLDPDSDLGDRLVTVHVAPLSQHVVETALKRGLACARRYRARGLIVDAALTLQGRTVTLGGEVPASMERVAL